MFNLTQQLSLDVESRIIQTLTNHFKDHRNWVLVDRKENPNTFFTRDLKPFMMYKPPSVSEIFALGKFADISSVVFEQVRKGMVRTGQIDIYDETLTIRCNQFFILKGRNMAASYIYLGTFPESSSKVIRKRFLNGQLSDDINDDSIYDNVADGVYGNPGPLVTYVVDGNKAAKS